jgi:hypothetical protein
LAASKVTRATEMKQNGEKSLWEMEELIKINDRIKQLTACDSTEEIIELSQTILNKN